MTDVSDTVAARIAAAVRKRARMKQQRAALEEARQHGLAARHAAKLARPVYDPDTEDFLTLAVRAGAITDVTTDAFGRSTATLDPDALRAYADHAPIGRDKAHAIVDELFTGQKGETE